MTLPLHGFHGCYRRVDLGRGTSEIVSIPTGVLRRYLGGVGLGCWVLAREAPAGVEPLAPEAPLVFCFSPLVGTPLAALLDSLILCKFLRGAFEDVWADSAELLRAVTGWDFDSEELHRVARRVVDLRKSFNVREGWKPDDDTLPDRFLEEPLAGGAAAGARLSRARLQAMVRSYNLARGWSAEGYPTSAATADLGLDTRGL